MTTTGRVLITLALTALTISGTAAYIMRPAAVEQKAGGRWKADSGPVPVRAVAASAADVPVHLDAVGTARALNTVLVQPQVGGKVLEIAFAEGQTVEKGQVLAKIDPTTYQAALDQASAKFTQDLAQLANARMDLERYTRIPGAIPVKTVDTQRSLVAQLEGQVASSKAAVDQAKAQLGYTSIVAPITGRTGIRQVDQGNIVAGSGGQAIVMIAQVQPITVIFNIPQQQLGQVNRAAALGQLAVDAMEGDNRRPLDRGRLQVVDNQVDQTTGTVKMKAEFPNDNLQLWPGQFINVRVLIETLGQAIVVPTAAVQRGPQGSFVYVVGSDNKVTAKPVTVRQQDDRRAVIGSGLAVAERVVTTGFARLKEGAEVAVAAAGEEEALPPGKRGEGKRKRDGAAPGDAQSGQNRDRSRKKRDEPAAPVSAAPVVTTPTEATRAAKAATPEATSQ